MPGYIIHIAVAKEYAKKHKIKNVDDFIKGSIAPDFTNDKSTTHYGKSPAYTNLGNYLKENTILTDYDKGFIGGFEFAAKRMDSFARLILEPGKNSEDNEPLKKEMTRKIVSRIKMMYQNDIKQLVTYSVDDKA